MVAQNVAFWIFAAFMAAGAIRVVTTDNIVHAAIFAGNLDEFFQVRVAALHDRVAAGFLGALLEQLFADQVLEHGPLDVGQVGRMVGQLHRRRHPAVELGLGDETVVDADDDLLDQFGARESSREAEGGQGDDGLAHGGHY